MKYILLVGAIIAISMHSIPGVYALTTTEQNTVDRVITRRHTRQQASLLSSRTQTLLDRINDLQQRARLTQEAGALLNYIEIRLTNILRALENKPLIGLSSTNTLPNPPHATGFPTTLPLPERIDGNPLLIAGTVSPLFWEIRYTVSGEPIIINELVISSNKSNLHDRVHEFALYDQSGRFVSSTVSDGNTIRFNNFAAKREIGSHKFYLALLPYSADSMYTQTPIDFTLSAQNIYGEGVYSNSSISSPIQNTSSSTITLSPVGIGTVKFIDERNGYRTSSYLNNGETTFGILEITTPIISSQYTQNIVLGKLSVRVRDNTTARQVANNLRLARIDNSSSTTSIGGIIDGNTVNFYLDTLPYYTVEQGQNAYFRFTASTSIDSYDRESVQLSIENLKNGGLTYRQDGNYQNIATIQQGAWETLGPVVSD